MKKLTILFFAIFAFCLKMSAQLQLPSVYDPRASGMISPPSNQRNTNNCWIHSSVASLEMNLIKTNGTILKYSENYYNYLRAATRDSTRGGFIEYNPHAMANGALDGLGHGVSVLPIFNYMVNWLGPVLYEEFPYSLSPEKQPLDMAYIAPNVHVQGYEYLAPIGALGGPTNQNEKVLQIKTAVYNNGAATIGDNGHSVAIIGWDDSRNGGSFLIKNSYGSNDDNYWIRYNSATITGSSQHLLSVNHVEPTNNYFQNYFHTQVMNSHSSLPGANSVTMANVFTREITADERIDAAGFSTLHPNTAYEIYVNPNGSTLNASSLIKVAEGVAEKPGFRTIRITQLLLNATSTKFAVAVKYTLPSGVTTFEFEAQGSQQQMGPAPAFNFVGVNTGESFFTTGNLNSSWTDMATRTFSSHNGVNVPIRAYTNIGADATTTVVVMFNSNGGSAVDARTTTRGSTINRPTNPTRAGHTFVGWFSDEELTQEFSFFSTAVMSSIMLYAKWTSTTAIGLEQGISDTPLRAWIADGVLHIGGLTVGETYRVYTIGGTLVYQGIATTDIVGAKNFSPLPSGTYIIQSGNKSTKIVW